MNKTLYIPPADAALWEAAERVASRHDMSLYRLIAEALENHVPAVAERPTRAERWATVATDAA